MFGTSILRLNGAILLTALGACAAEDPPPLIFPEGAQSAFIITAEVGRSTARLADLARTSVVRTEARGQMTVLFYERSLAEWALPEGDIILQADGRPLDPFSDAFALDSGANVWRPIDELPSDLAELRVPDFDPIACVDAGRCVGPEEAGQRWCQPACRPEPVTEPDAPEAPLPIASPACPDGWSRVAIDQRDGLCRPPDRIDDCGLTEVQWLGSAECAPIGDPCPVGRWPDELLGRLDVLYVDALASVSGDGSEQAPFVTLDEALAAVSTTATIALASGRYRASVPIDVDVVLRGACVEGTVIEAGPADIVLHARASLEVRNLALEGGRHGVLAVGSAADVQLKDLMIRATADANYGVWIRQGARAGMERVVVRDRAGLLVDGRSDVQSRDFVVSAESDQAALGLTEGSTGRFERVALSVTEVFPLASPGVLLSVGGSDLRLDQAWIEHGKMNGLWVLESSTVAASDLWVIDGRTEQPDSTDGNGVFVGGTSSVSIDRAGFEAHQGSDLVVEQGSAAVLRDVTSVSAKLRGSGGGFVVFEGARFRLSRAIVDCLGTGFQFFGGAQTEVEDLVLETRLLPTATNGFVVRDGAEVIGRRWWVEQDAGTGVLVVDRGRLDLSDATVLGTTAVEGSGGSSGFYFEDAPGSSLRRARVDLDGQRGLSIKSGLELEDIRVRGRLEWSLRVDVPAGGGPVGAKRIAVSGENGVGLEVIAETQFDGVDLSVEGGAVGINVYELARADLHRFDVRGVDGRGVVRFDDAITAGAPSLALVDGVIASCAVGLSFNGSASEAAALIEGVSFDTNATNLEILPAP